MERHNIDEDLKSVEEHFKLPQGTISKIVLGKSDFEFIIMCAVISEGMITLLVKKKVPDESLVDWILSNTMFAKRLDLLKKTNAINISEVIAVLKAISRIRNMYAHNPEYITTSLDDFFKKQTQEVKLEISNPLTKIVSGPQFNQNSDFSEIKDDVRKTIFEAWAVANFALSGIIKDLA